MNLLFDLDGTLTDPYPGVARSILYALDKLGRPLPPEDSLGWCIGPPLKTSFTRLLDAKEDGLAEKAVKFYRERFGTIGLYENEVYEGIPQALEILNEEGHILYVATSKPTVYAKRIVGHFGLGQYFRTVYGSELDGTRSDKTSLIAHILLNESIDVFETIMIGDRKHDMIGAKGNGVDGVGVLWGYGTRNELETSGAKTCVKHPGYLISAVGDNGAGQR